jgi:hypothetical protein
MRGWLHVHAPEEYEAWVRENKAAPVQPGAGKGS